MFYFFSYVFQIFPIFPYSKSLPKKNSYVNYLLIKNKLIEMFHYTSWLKIKIFIVEIIYGMEFFIICPINKLKTKYN